MIERGVDPSLGILFVLDGSKALAKAVRDRFPNAVIQRCRVHKLRNVTDHLPEAKRRRISTLMKAAWKLPHAEALQKLEEIAKEIEVAHPGAAASLREGLLETLAVTRLGLPQSPLAKPGHHQHRRELVQQGRLQTPPGNPLLLRENGDELAGHRNDAGREGLPRRHRLQRHLAPQSRPRRASKRNKRVSAREIVGKHAP